MKKIKDFMNLVKDGHKIGYAESDGSIAICYGLKKFYRVFHNYKFKCVKKSRIPDCDFIFIESCENCLEDCDKKL